MLLIAGDVHPHPGPGPRKHKQTLVGAPLEGRDVLEADVLPVTVAHYERAITHFEHWLRARDVHGVAALLALGLEPLVQITVEYLRTHYSHAQLSAAEVGNLISGLKRLVIIAQSLGAPLPDPSLHFRALWRIHRSWALTVPSEFRQPVDFKLTILIAFWLWTHGHWRAALLVLIGFHGLLRPGELMHVTWGCIMLWDEIEQSRFGDTYGLIRVRQPKTRRMTGHAPVQHVLLEDPGLAALLRWTLDRTPASVRGKPLWSQPQHKFATLFGQACAGLGIQCLGLTPAGLRGGGATDYWIRTRDVPNVRRRGRWTTERTLERYLQEGAALSQRERLEPATRAYLDNLLALAVEFFRQVQLL